MDDIVRICHEWRRWGARLSRKRWGDTKSIELGIGQTWDPAVSAQTEQLDKMSQFG